MPKILGSLGSAQLWNVSQVESSRRGRSKRKPTKPQCVPGLVGFTRVQRGQGKGSTYLVAGILLLFAYGILGRTLLGLSSFHLTERPPPPAGSVYIPLVPFRIQLDLVSLSLLPYRGGIQLLPSSIYDYFQTAISWAREVGYLWQITTDWLTYQSFVVRCESCKNSEREMQYLDRVQSFNNLRIECRMMSEPSNDLNWLMAYLSVSLLFRSLFVYLSLSVSWCLQTSHGWELTVWLTIVCPTVCLD